MKYEQLSPNAIKLTLSAEEAADMPQSHCRDGLRSFIRALTDEVRQEGCLSLPKGKLLAEIYKISDGSCIIFISVISPNVAADRLFACELCGIENLRGLSGALMGSSVKLSVYCGAEPQSYRVIFDNPPSYLRHICCEYGEYCEITRLFAAQTAEYLNAIAENCSADTLCELLSC